MALETLKSKTEIDVARAWLDREGLSYVTKWPPPVVRPLLQRFGFDVGVTVGDRVKSWDVLKTAEFIREHVLLESRILDIGAYASEILCVLHAMKYTALYGIDLDSRIKQMPFNSEIHYEIGDFTRTAFDTGSFGCITAVSVIEHGFNANALLSEITRLLVPGGFFIASFDYWPEKIDTSGVKIFGLDWLIFSQADVLRFVESANDFQLAPYGELRYAAQDQVMKFASRQYTFAWLVLQKRL